jgi:hypothetical protein
MICHSNKTLTNEIKESNKTNKKKRKDIFTRYIASQTLEDGEGNSFEEGEERDKKI